MNEPQEVICEHGFPEIPELGQYCEDCIDLYLDSLPVEPCPHGTIGECNTCNILGDFAFDAARERSRR